MPQTNHRQPQEFSTHVCARIQIGTLGANAREGPRRLKIFQNATLKLIPFEAHTGREANTVLSNLTKKTSLMNLN